MSGSTQDGSCKQCRSPKGSWHKMSCTEPGGGKGRSPFCMVGGPRQMLFGCRHCDASVWITQFKGDEIPKNWKKLGDGAPLCPTCSDEWSAKPEDERS